MTYVLIALAVGAVLVGPILGLPALWTGHHPLFEQFLAPMVSVAKPLLRSAHYGHGLEWGLMLSSVLIALAGWFLARALYKDEKSRVPLLLLTKPNLRFWHDLIYHKYYVDEIYHATVIAGSIRLMNILDWFDQKIIDGLVNFAGWLGRFVSYLHGLSDKYFVDGLVNLVGEATIGGGSQLRKIQTGRVQDYVYILVGGGIILAIVIFGAGLDVNWK
jgi:NADH-quinone oxidoreductase subunit L